MGTRRDFTLTTKLQSALQYMDCPKCGNGPLSETGVEWDHISPWAISQDRSVENCQPLCPTCHALKTCGPKHYSDGDISKAAKVKRLSGERPKRKTRPIPSRPLPTGRRFPTKTRRQT